MALNFDSLVIDRVVDGIAEDFSGNLLYRLNQLSNVSINTSAETKDKTDANGVLIKRFFTAKTVEFSAESNVLSLSLMAAQNGSTKEIATTDNKLPMPKCLPITTAGIKEYTLKQKPLAPLTKIYAVEKNGTLGKVYEVDTAANADKFSYDAATGKITFPTGELPAELFVKYDYETDSGIKVYNRADEFPKTVKLTLRVLVADTCSVDTVRLAYVVFPSFQISPDCDLTLDTESTQAFSGAAQADYCAANQDLYYIALAEDDLQ